MKTLLLAASLLLPIAANASEVAPMAGLQKTLRDGGTALIYYTAETDGYHVVTTMQFGEIETPTIVRFTATLLPGQSAEVSVPHGVDQSPEAIMIRRDGQRLLVDEQMKVASLAQ